MSKRWFLSLVLALLLAGSASAAAILHEHGVNDATTEHFSAGGTWAVTLAAYCYEGFGFVEATILTEDGTVVDKVTVMGEGIDRVVLDTDPGTYYIFVQASYWHVYNWELLVEEGEGSAYEYGVELMTVAQHGDGGHDHGHGNDHESDHDGDAPVIHVPDSIWDGAFTTEQADRGRFLYNAQCAMCHGDDLISEDGYSPDLTGFSFTSRWHDVSIDDRRIRIQTTMPQGNPNSLSDQETLDIIAHILRQNRYPAGEHELLPGEHLEGLIIEPPRD